MVFTWYYIGWIRETFPPTTALLIRSISGLILGMVIGIFSFRKFFWHVKINKDLIPGVAIARVGSDRFDINPPTTIEMFASRVGYTLLRVFPKADTIGYGPAKVITFASILLVLFLALFGIASSFYDFPPTLGIK
jgi:hypothetical protein